MNTNNKLTQGVQITNKTQTGSKRSTLFFNERRGAARLYFSLVNLKVLSLFVFSSKSLPSKPDVVWKETSGYDNENYPTIAKNLSQHQIHCFCVCVSPSVFVYLCVLGRGSPQGKRGEKSVRAA